jgi:penicillin-binding protein 1C
VLRLLRVLVRRVSELCSAGLQPRVLAGALALVATLVWLRCGPVAPSLLVGVDSPSTVVVDRHGTVLYEALSSTGSRSARLDASALPPVLVAATIAAEDRRFFSHVGVDPRAWLRAARHNLLERRIVEGGSTISQQVAKLLIQRQEGITPRGIRAKLRETVLALRLEHRFTKAEILAMYLNLASYGTQITGAARASDMYFGVDPSMLTAAQAAFLAALPQRPTAFNPRRNIAAAQTRQRLVLRRMAVESSLTQDQLREALAERLSLDRGPAPFLAPHFVEMAIAAAGTPRTARIDTTLDLPLQLEIEGILARQRETLRRHGAQNVAVVVLDNRSSEWIAWEGSGDYFDTEHGGAINGSLAPRQPGSALKPFTYALGFEEGRTPATVLADIPSHFPTAEPGVLYSPRNYDGKYWGPLLARRALAGSENVPAVALASQVGVSTLVRFLTRAGFTTFEKSGSYYGLGVTLGNAEVRLDQLVAAYAAFARGGLWREPTILRGNGERVADRVIVSPRTAFWVTDILSDADARSFVFGRGGDLEFPFPVAVKTGTSQAYHDNWTVGYTRSVTVGVWVGNFDRTPLRDSSGVTGAGPIFHAVMLAAEHRVGEPATMDAIVPAPPDVHEATICALSGMRANPWCPTRMREWVRVEDEPVPCSWHHQSEEGLLTVYPPEFRVWAGNGDTHSFPTTGTSAENLNSHRFSAPAGTPTQLLTIANPPGAAIYSIDPTLRSDFQALPLRAVTPGPTMITWTVDGRRIGTASSEHALAWPLEVGTHQIEARDTAGHTTSTAVIVK